MNKEKLAQRTLQLIYPGVSQFDPLTILLLIQTITAIISALKACGYMDASIQAKVARPNWLMRFRLKRITNKHITDAKLAAKVADMLPVAASELTPDEFGAVYSEGE
jgi:hypothetical protein